MNQYIQAQVRSLIEGMRVLETYASSQPAPIAELENARKSLAGLTTQDAGSLGTSALNGVSASLTLEVIESMRSAVEILTASSVTTGELQLSTLSDTLGRAAMQVGSDVRARIAERLSGIYVIVDPEATRGRPVTEVAAQSLQGGARVVQLRDKLNDKGPMLETARELKSICDEHDALFVMNDHADLARAAAADVLHVGQTDLPVGDAREILAPHQLIGNSNGGMEEALRSREDSVDYIAVGAIYATTTMGKSGRRALGPEMITRAKEAVSQPVVAIGGINRSNIQDVVMAGADSVCVVSAITFADDPKAATEELVHLHESAAN